MLFENELQYFDSRSQIYYNGYYMMALQLWNKNHLVILSTTNKEKRTLEPKPRIDKPLSWLPKMTERQFNMKYVDQDKSIWSE